MKVRIKFSKYGPLRYIGHLDILRYFQKAVRRSKINIAYSEGYSPHQIMSFAAPLGVGMETDGDYLDIEMKDLSLTSEEMTKMLNAEMAYGIRIKGMKKLPDNTPNAMASVAAAEYIYLFKKNIFQSLFSSKEELKALCNEFFSQDIIEMEKQTKKSSTILDIRPHIFDWKFIDDKQTVIQSFFEFHDKADYESDIILSVFVDASSSGNLKPISLLNLILSKKDLSINPSDLIILRADTYGKREDVFIPLFQFGDTF